MSVAVIRFELERMVAQAQEHIHEAQELLEHGTEGQRVKAASKIAFFRTERPRPTFGSWKTVVRAFSPTSSRAFGMSG